MFIGEDLYLVAGGGGGGAGQGESGSGGANAGGPGGGDGHLSTRNGMLVGPDAGGFSVQSNGGTSGDALGTGGAGANNADSAEGAGGGGGNGAGPGGGGTQDVAGSSGNYPGGGGGAGWTHEDVLHPLLLNGNGPISGVAVMHTHPLYPGSAVGVRNNHGGAVIVPLKLAATVQYAGLV